MQRVMDLRQYKTALRERYRTQRQALEPEQKARLDRDVATRFFRLNQYRSCRKNAMLHQRLINTLYH